MEARRVEEIHFELARLVEGNDHGGPLVLRAPARGFIGQGNGLTCSLREILVLAFCKIKPCATGP